MKKMKKLNQYKLKIGSLLALLIAIGAWITFLQPMDLYFFNKKHSVEMKEIPGLKPIPEFKLPRSDGSFFSSKELENHVVIVHFWASWCAPCVPEISEILKASKKLQQDKNGKSIYWLLISQDESFEKAKKVLKDDMLSKNIISVLDKDAKISDQFGTYQFPETYLITREGGILTKWIGALEWNGVFGEKVLKDIDELSVTGKTPAE